jgi:hypothetical protein
MTTTFRLAADELDQTFLDRVKAMFREKQVSIVVYEENELPSNKNGKQRFHSVEEALAQFSAPTLDTRGWKFNRDEANER